MQNKIISLPKFFGKPDMHGQALPTCIKWSVVAIKKGRRLMPEIFLQETGYFCSPQFCLKVAVQGESDRHCKAENHISENDCLHSSLVVMLGVEPKCLNF